MYSIFFHGFWNGFLDKKDANNVSFFESFFELTNLHPCIISNDLANANILVESVFTDQTLKHSKDWKFKILYIGEPHFPNFDNYDIILAPHESTNNIIDLPLYVNYIHNNNFMERLMNRPFISTIPENFCLFIVSNGNCPIRNKMFHMLNRYKKVHSYGRYENNMNRHLDFNYWTEDYFRFLSTYKFIICFENSKVGTYSTEKIINAYMGQTIPIYWSSHHIHNVFNPDSMIFLYDESENSFEQIMDTIVELDSDDDKYLEFINRPIFNSADYWENNYTLEIIAEKINHFISN